MPFTLRVEFRGLCMHVRHTDPRVTRVAVLMPDARATNEDPVILPNGKNASPHVGYLACDLDDVVGAPDVSGELVHLFSRETLQFMVPERPSEERALAVPDFSVFAPTLQPVAGVFSPDPPDTLLMRTIVDGGSLVADTTGPRWEIPVPLGRGGMPHSGKFADHVTWKRHVEDDHVDLRLTGFGGGGVMTLRLRPRPGLDEVVVRIANLCADNPLRWEDLGQPSVIPQREDLDFLWFYRLLEPAPGSDVTDLSTRSGALPVPVLGRRKDDGGSRGNPPGCDESTAAFAFGNFLPEDPAA